MTEGLLDGRRAGRYGEGLALANLGLAYQELRRFEEAADCRQDALAILRQTGDRHGEGVTPANLGNAYQELRQPDLAAAC